MRATLIRVFVVIILLVASIVAWKEISVAPGPDAPETIEQPKGVTARDRAMQAVRALQKRDMQEFSTMVHPVKGVRFFPYTYVVLSETEAIPADVVQAFPTMSSTRTWGIQDGSGEPIVLPHMQYLDRYVYDRDYVLAEDIRENDKSSQGNVPNNVVEAYPDATVISFHMAPENPDYGGMDWRNLRLVLEQKDGVWYVIAVVHDEWTI